MCSICDGTTYDEVLTDTRGRIDRSGFTLAGIEPGPDQPPWLYTIGLVERHNHPEVSVLGVPVPRAQQLLDIVARRVLAGERLAAGVDLMVGSRRFHVDELDERVVAGDMLAQWHDYYGWRGLDELRPSVLELVRCGRSRR
ncbi:MAG TPA: DUF4262 domain-containing protein [Acidimicrobiales bacterium]|jgi:hypothetical protein|nr:DUF4262 domain-containing protein [Acidimicrobiales bacterium]